MNMKKVLLIILLCASSLSAQPLMSVGAGELSPLLKYRVDFDKRYLGVQTLENMLVKPQGTAVRRPGLYYIADTKSNTRVRLTDFTFSTDDAYIQEWGNLYVRFYRNGGQVLDDSDDPYEVTTTYTTAQLRDLHFVQSLDVVYIFHPDVAPRKLSRTDHDDWAIADVDWLRGPFEDQNTGTTTITPSAATGTITLTASAATFNANHVGSLWQVTHTIEGASVTGSFNADDVDSPSSSLAIRLGQAYEYTTHGNWTGTINLQRSYDAGVVWKDVLIYDSLSDRNASYPDEEENADAIYRVVLTDYTGDQGRVHYSLISYTHDVDGVVDITAYTSTTVVTGTVDSTLGGTGATDRWAEGAWSTDNGWPRTGCFYQDRLIVGGNEELPVTIWASQTGDYENMLFDNQEDDAIVYEMAGAQQNPIVWLFDGKGIIAGTSGSVMRIASANSTDEGLTYKNISSSRISSTGSTTIQPVGLGEQIVFIDRDKRRVRSLGYELQTDGYIAPDLTQLAEHISDPCFVEIAVQRSPDPIVWFIRQDGTACSMTFSPDENILAWARHPMPTGSADEVIEEEVPAVPAVAATYTMTLVSENGSIWGVPVGDGEMLAGLDASGVAVDLGGGLVGLPYASHPFAAGETARITNTTNYNASEVVHANTTANQIVITSAFNAETFDGTEVVVKHIASLSSGAGRMVQDNDGNLYYGHAWSAGNNTYITKIETDGTLVYDFLDMSNAPAGAYTAGSVRGLAITPDGEYIYAYVDGPANQGNVYKWNLSTGAEEWLTTYDGDYLAWPGYYMDVDADGNSYICMTAGDTNITKITSDGVTMSKLTLMGSKKTGSHITATANYVALVDDDMGIVITGGQQSVTKAWGESALLYNFAVRTFDDSVGDQIRIGDVAELPSASYDGTYSLYTGNVATYDGYIYVLMDTPTPKLYKISWDGTSLAIVDSVAAGTYAVGMYFDLYGNLVTVNQDWVTGQDDVLWFYDTDLTYLSKTEGMYTLMLKTWDATVGGSWQQGNAVFDGALAVDAVAAVPAVTSGTLGLGYNSVAVIPGNGEDEVWFAISRVFEGTQRYKIEQMQPQDWGSDQNDIFFVDCGLTYDGVEATTLTGLDHLNGEEVQICGDGGYYQLATVASGSVTLDEGMTVAHVGLAYTSTLKTFPIESVESLGLKKRMPEVILAFYKTLLCEYGINGGTMYPILFDDRTVIYGGADDLFTGYRRLGMDTHDSEELEMHIRQTQPFPMAVTVIVPRMEIAQR